MSRRGRHRRRRRWFGPVVVALVSGVVALLLTLDHVGGAPAPGPARPEAGAAGGQRPTPEGAPSPPSRPAVAATTEGLVELLVRLLPPGRLTDVRRLPEDVLGAHLTYHRGGYTNYIEFWLGSYGGDERTRVRDCRGSQRVAARCVVLPNGAVAFVGRGSRCDVSVTTEVYHSDTILHLAVQDCPGYDLPPTDDPVDAERGFEDGRFNAFEVLLIAADDQWGTTLRPELVEAGRRNHPDLPRLPARRPNR